MHNKAGWRFCGEAMQGVERCLKHLDVSGLLVLPISLAPIQLSDNLI
jgi:hypothetical protein